MDSKPASAIGLGPAHSQERPRARGPIPDRPVKYPRHSPLRAELNKRVEAYFSENALKREGGPRMWLKTFLVLTWAVGTYLLLILWAESWLTALPLAACLGLALAGAGFTIMHDAAHSSYSRWRFLNRLGAWLLDLLGGSSYDWNFKHNMFHHSYPNVMGADDDLDAGFWIRLSPGQPLRSMHRFQHWYAWILYGFLPLKWFLLDDFTSLVKGRIGIHKVPPPRGLALLGFFVGKLVFAAWVLALPLYLGHSLLVILAVYGVTSAVLGMAMSIVFQLAHCVDGTAFAAVPPEGERLERPWAEHQLATTFDFCPNNSLVTWYMGGLNYQVEHHLFPRVCHLHYPAIRPIVKEVCTEFGVTHNTNPTLWSALKAHARHLKRVGRDQAQPAPA